MQHVCGFYRFGDHYEWNKVTSCIHNILSGQRWIEHYGEMAIKNINSNACQCKITFVKVRKQRYLNHCLCCECLCSRCEWPKQIFVPRLILKGKKLGETSISWLNNAEKILYSLWDVTFSFTGFLIQYCYRDKLYLITVSCLLAPDLRFTIPRTDWPEKISSQFPVF